MNEKQARLSIRKLLDDNSTTLLSGIIHFGEQREFVHLTTSSATPPTGYYYLAVLALTSTSDVAGSVNNPTPRMLVKHDIEIALVDYIDSVAAEVEVYEGMDQDFQLLGDRIVELLEATNFIVSDDGDSFRLDRTTSVIKTNQHQTWEDAQNWYAMLFANIGFTLIEC